MAYHPINYKVHLEPNISEFTFKGNVKVNLSGEGDHIDLNAKELSIISVSSGPKSYKFFLDLETEKLTIDLGEKQTGNLDLDIEFTGEINDKLAGLYRSKFMVAGEERYAAVTQFQESDARRVFPCVDKPGAKATFDISFLVEKDYFTISNTEIVEEEIRGEKKFVRFATTPKMSTYLVFFGIGDFEFIEGKAHGKRVRVLAHPGKAKNNGEFALDFGIKTLEYCEDYYGIPYPLSKMDLIATPSFAHGAMENWGAILFRENLLLRFEGVTSKMNETFIQMVIAHEIAHQWFGNLVTPETWKYLWLNESFATFFGYGVVGHYYPEKNIWETFITSETSGALGADAKLHTAPIERPGDGAVGMTITNAPIIYNKGGSVLRQVKAYVGDKYFKKGLNQFLTKYKYSVAKSNDLWESLEDVSGKPVSKMMETWVLQEGYPLVEAILEGTTLKFKQKRFTYLPNSEDTIWSVPISVRAFRKDGSSDDFQILLEEKTGELNIGECESYLLNIEHTGFFRTLYPENAYTSLKEMVSNKSISAIDRWGIENDLYALIVAKVLPFDMYFDVIKAYKSEESRLVLSSIFTHLRNFEVNLDGERREKMVKQGSEFLTEIIENLGLEPREGESDDIAIVRSPMLLTAGIFGVKSAVNFALSEFERFKNGEKVSPDILGTVIRIAAKETNDFEYFYNAFKDAENEQLAIHFLVAMASFSDKELITKVQGMIFEKIPNRNRGTVISTLCGNKVAKESMWHYYLANLDNFESLFPFMYQSVLMNLISNSKVHEEDMKGFFEEYQKKNPIAKEAVNIGFEYLEINKRLSQNS